MNCVDDFVWIHVMNKIVTGWKHPTAGLSLALVHKHVKWVWTRGLWKSSTQECPHSREPNPTSLGMIISQLYSIWNYCTFQTLQSRGSLSRGSLSGGLCPWGSLSMGVSVHGGSLSGGLSVQREIPPWTEWQMRVETLPCPTLHLRAVKMFYKQDKYYGGVDLYVDEWILEFTRPLHECLKSSTKDPSSSWLRLCLHIMVCCLFLSAAPLIFSTFCNVWCEYHQRNAFNPF